MLRVMTSAYVTRLLYPLRTRHAKFTIAASAFGIIRRALTTPFRQVQMAAQKLSVLILQSLLPQVKDIQSG